MKKITALLLCIVMLIPIAGCGGNDGPKEITILTLHDYLPQETIDDFTADTGIAVNNVTVSTYEEIQELVVQDPAAYDLVITCDYVLNDLVKNNLLQEINYKKFPNDKYVIPGYKGKYYDPENKFTVPYAAVGVLIGYNPYEAGIIIDSYADLLAPGLENSIIYADDFELVVGLANVLVGNDPSYIDEEMNETSKMLRALSANMLYITDGDTYVEDHLISGKASVGVLYTSQLGYALASNPEIEIVYPKEGFFASIDCMAIPTGADGKNYAMQFINYAQDPPVNGKLAQNILYSSTNISGKQFMDEEYRNDGYNIKNDMATKCILVPKLDQTTSSRFKSLHNYYFNSRKKRVLEEENAAQSVVEPQAVPVQP